MLPEHPREVASGAQVADDDLAAREEDALNEARKIAQAAVDTFVLRFLLDEGVPDAVGKVLEAAGHEVIYGNRSLARGAKDPVVSVAALRSDSILVAADHDMKRIARGYEIGSERFKKLSLLKLSCRKPEAAEKVKRALSLIEHEWRVCATNKGRRIWIEIQQQWIRTGRDLP